MEQKNYFKNSNVKYLIPFFIITVIINVLCAVLVQKMLLHDGGIHFLNMLNNFSDGNWDFNAYFGSRQRVFVFIVNNLLLNISYHIFNIESKQTLAQIYTASWFFTPLIILVFQILLAKRTKRYDIAVCAFMLYAVFIQPCQMYPILEVIPASSSFLLLLHYYLSDIDYKPFDISAITLLLIFSACSDEVVILGIIATLITAYYPIKTENNSKNKSVKKYIYFGMIAILAIYALSYILVPQYHQYGGSERFNTELYFLLKDLTHSYTILFPLFVLFILSFFVLNKLKKNTDGIYPITISSFSVIFIFTYIYNFHNGNTSFSARWFLYAGLTFATLLCTIFPLIKNTVTKEKFYDYLLFLSMIIGIFYAGLQIYFAYDYHNTKNLLLNNAKSEKTIVVTDYDNPEFFKINSVKLWLAKETYTYNQISFSKEKEINVLMYANEEFKPKRNEERIFLPFGDYNIKNKFWDLTKAVSELPVNKEL